MTTNGIKFRAIGRGNDQWVVIAESQGQTDDFAVTRSPVDAELISIACNSHYELLTACQVALEYLDRQNNPRNAIEYAAFKEHQRLILRAAIQAATE